MSVQSPVVVVLSIIRSSLYDESALLVHAESSYNPAEFLANRALLHDYFKSFFVNVLMLRM